MPFDTYEMFGHSMIQHGSYSDRVYLMKLDSRNLPEVVVLIEDLALTHGYAKLFAKVPASASKDFYDRGFRKESSVPGFFRGEEDGLFMCKYLDPRREVVDDEDNLKDVLQLAQSKVPERPRAFTLPNDMAVIGCRPEHVDQMSRIYQAVFPSYPFPIHDPDYLQETMAYNVDYFAVEKEGKLIALSSAEMDAQGSNAEMTDFATLPENRGQGLARCLLQEMEAAMNRRGIQTAYTIARAASAGMNITFAQLGYQFGGLLINNTQISGSIESMNVWYKSL